MIPSPYKPPIIAATSNLLIASFILVLFQNVKQQECQNSIIF
jgi:hypothetical protein